MDILLIFLCNQMALTFRGYFSRLWIVTAALLIFYFYITTNGSRSSHTRAYATHLVTANDDGHDEDHHFTAVRVLIYQLLHQPQTRSSPTDIPILVLVSPSVSELKRQTLISEGASVVPVQPVGTERLSSFWKDHFSKIRLFEMTQYDRILYLDPNILINKPLDMIWSDPAIRHSQRTIRKVSTSNEVHLPESYLFASTPRYSNQSSLLMASDISDKFWLIQPDITLFRYYCSIMENKDNFDPAFGIQGLLGYAHRRNGSMPSKHFPPRKWNTEKQEIHTEDTCATFSPNFTLGESRDSPSSKLWWRTQGQMEGYWQGRRQVQAPYLTPGVVAR
jgi:hypothetical protein